MRPGSACDVGGRGAFAVAMLGISSRGEPAPESQTQIAAIAPHPMTAPTIVTVRPTRPEERHWPLYKTATAPPVMATIDNTSALPANALRSPIGASKREKVRTRKLLRIDQ